MSTSYLKLVVDNTKAVEDKRIKRAHKPGEQIRREEMLKRGEWRTKFALFPVKLEDVGWVWFCTYQALTREAWTGGVCGGYITRTEARVMFRSSYLLSTYESAV